MTLKLTLLLFILCAALRWLYALPSQVTAQPVSADGLCYCNLCQNYFVCDAETPPQGPVILAKQ